jgi:hypothetical protein
MSQIPQLMNGNRLQHDAVSDKGFYTRSIGDHVQIFSDFIGGGVLPSSGSGLVQYDDSSSGAPTLLHQPKADGIYRMKLASTSEAERCAVYLGDDCCISPTKKPIFEARVAITTASPNAAETLIIGLVSARNDTVASIADHCMFKWTGANNNILIDTDDGTTDTSDQDTTSDWVSGTYYKFKIDMSDLTDVKFFIDGERQLRSTTFDVSAMAASDYLQPIVEIQKASGTTVPQVDIDYISVLWERS